MAIKLDDYFDDTPEHPAGRQDSGNSRPEEAAQKDGQEGGYEDVVIVTKSQRRKKRIVRLAVLAVAAAVLATAVNLLFFSKKATGGQVRGYLVSIEKREGIVFDSYECALIKDYPDGIGNPDDLVFRFSTTDRHVGQTLYNAMKGDSLVLVDYVRYTTVMPWRGETDVVSDSVMIVCASPVSRTPEQVSADKKNLLPRPEKLP